MSNGLDREARGLVDQTLERFVRDYGDIHRRRGRLAESPVDERRYWPVMAEVGVLALPLGEDVGGIGGGAADVAAAAGILGGGVVVEPFVEGAVVAGALLNAVGGHAAVGVLEKLVSGEALPVVVRGGLSWSDDGGGGRVRGRARVVPAIGCADLWLVIAVDAGGEPVVTMLDAAAHRDRLAVFRLMDGRSAGDVSFDEVAVDAEAVLARGEVASKVMERVSMLAVNAYAGDAVGVMARLLRETGEYLVTRKQFGVVIGDFQALRHRYADMHMVWLEARAMVKALSAVIDGEDVEGADDVRWLAAATAFKVEDAAARIGHEAIQMHGGMGVTEELVVSHLNARLVVLGRQIRAWVPRSIGWGEGHDA